jgi:ComF family protein
MGGGLLGKMLTRTLEATFDWLAPRGCIACDAPLGSSRAFCADCHTGAAGAMASGGSPPVFSAGPYAAPYTRAIQRFKYGGRTDLATQLGELVAAAAVLPLAAERPLVVAVPLHPLKLAARGYNQSALLARAVARNLQLPCAPLALVRLRHTAAQAASSRSERITQLAGSFAVRSTALVRERPVLLVDDVVTTGATLAACRQALASAGARVTALLAVARTL